MIIIFLNLATFVLSTSVFHMSKSSYGFHFIGSLYKMKKYKRIKKYFHFTSRSNSYKLIEICSKFYFCLWKENKWIETVKRCIISFCLKINSSVLMKLLFSIFIFFLLYLTFNIIREHRFRYFLRLIYQIFR